MNSISAKISSVILAFLMLISTFSLTIEKHFCEGDLVDISYFGKTEGCTGEGGEHCDLTSVIEESDCCKDEVQQIDGQKELQKSSEERIELKQQQFIIAFVSSYNNLFSVLERQIVPHKNYFSPSLVSDIQVLHEVFII